MELQSLHASKLVKIAFGISVLAGLHLISLHNYLLFHNLAEIFSILVALSVFLVAWNSRRFLDDNYFLFLGVAYLFIGALDLVHNLTYTGMNILKNHDTDLPTQLWVLTRLMESVSLLIAPAFIGRKTPIGYAVCSYLFVTGTGLALIFFLGGFPTCFVEGTGLTPFKKLCELAACGVLLAALFYLNKKKAAFEPIVFQLLAGSIILTIASELAFTIYVHAYGISNLIGHYLKIISFYLIYKAIIEIGLFRPYDILFRNLKQSESELRTARESLERRVAERTLQLAKANEELSSQIVECELAEEALKESEAKYSTLVEDSLTGVYIVQDEKIVFANQKFADMFGYSKEELTGLDSLVLIHPEDRPLVENIRARRLSGQKVPEEYEVRGRKKNSEPIWVVRNNTTITYKGRPAVAGNVVDVTRKRQIHEALQQSEKELRILSTKLISAEEAERKRISRELHDSIGQALTAIKFGIENTLGLFREAPGAPKNIEALEAVVPLTQNAIEEVRRIMEDLRPSILDDLGILATVSWFCRDFQKIYSSISIEKEISVIEEDIPTELKTNIYRILQESLNNAAKHSEADLIRIVLKNLGENILLEVIDNGKGFNIQEALFNPDPEGGFGLVNMKERTELSGGRFVVNSREGAGTVIQASWRNRPKAAGNAGPGPVGG